jgi:hypothetical protein
MMMQQKEEHRLLNPILEIQETDNEMLKDVNSKEANKTRIDNSP